MSAPVLNYNCLSGLECQRGDAGRLVYFQSNGWLLQREEDEQSEILQQKTDTIRQHSNGHFQSNDSKDK